MLSLYYFLLATAWFSPLSNASQPLTTLAKAVVIRAADDLVATVTVTSMHTSTVFVTTSTFAYAISTATIMFTATETTYVSSISPASRRMKGRAIALGESALPSPNVKRVAETSTTTVEAGLTITSIVNIGTTYFDQIVSSTTTITLALAAPNYSHVYVAAAGCQDIPNVDTLQLDPSITDKDAAVGMCQDSCSQNGKCASLFVQQLFPSYGDTAPVYKCFMNGQSFDESSNLICGLAEDVWGTADAYDAVGRGAPN